ncbi:hypothetical protein [Dyadobacter sp. CY312]|uniref:hypothetical protein n=1 Tax=Dyadobacter sp. CY312 TaxID=2907303 RepID=UPI001F4195C2|nr:hypothetical protein [Dyadobacter sp. CY312]MCE7040265.1 hypothetical protein [Dyadobacter sp. CY312]
MKKSLLGFFIVILTGLFACSQYTYGQDEPLSSEALFSKRRSYKSFPVNAGEKYLALNKAPRIGKFRRYRFLIGDRISFKLKEDRKRFKGTILSISDSSFIVTNDSSGTIKHKEVKLGDVRVFKFYQRVPFVSEAAYYFPMGGLLYIGADFFNKGIDGKRFTTDASAFIVGGALMATGLVCHKLSSGTIKVNDRNRLGVLTSY